MSYAIYFISLMVYQAASKYNFYLILMDLSFNLPVSSET